MLSNCYDLLNFGEPYIYDLGDDRYSVLCKKRIQTLVFYCFKYTLYCGSLFFSAVIHNRRYTYISVVGIIILTLPEYSKDDINTGIHPNIRQYEIMRS